MKTKKEKFEGVSLRLSPESKRQLDDLMRWWGENRSRTMCRAIEKTHGIEALRKTEKKV